jgi:hypothetical protein
MFHSAKASVLLIWVIFSTFFCGCSRQWVISKGIQFVAPVIVKNGLNSFLKESDLIVADSGITSNLKLLEVLLECNPENKLLLNNLAFGYSAYALSFVEYEMEKAAFEENEELELFHRERARNLYIRARNYGFRSLSLTFHGKTFVTLITTKIIDMDAIKEQLTYISADQHEALFWTTISWGSYLQISRDNISELAMVPVFRLMNQRIQELDKEFFFGMPVMIDAMLYAMPPMVGGDEVISNQKFDMVSDINNGRCLLNPLFKARFYCTQFDYPEAGISILKDIVHKDTSSWPEKYTLMNEIAKRKARLYLKYADDIF